MSEIHNVNGILDVIHAITSNRESGQLEISSSGSRGILLFNEGRLVDATLESLTGFQAVNAAVSLRDVQFSFNPSISAPVQVRSRHLNALSCSAFSGSKQCR